MDNLGNFQWVNKAFTERTGMTVESLIKKMGKDIITATKTIDLTTIIHKVLSEKKITDIQNRRIRQK